jgi:signal recognition particle receptor subunit beta
MSQDELKSESSAGIKIVFFGSSLAGKTTALSIFHAIKNQTDPDAVYKFQKIEDKVTHRTIALDHATFGLGNKNTSGEHDFKYHLFTVPGQDRFKTMRRVVSEGLQGLIIVLDSTKAQWNDNRASLLELIEFFGERLNNGSIAVQIMLNKMDLPTESRITSYDAAKLLVETKVKKSLNEAQVNIIETSCLQAVKDLTNAIKTGSLKAAKDYKEYPPSIQRIIQPITSVIREILVKDLKKRS